jgi:DNA-binding NarL/FixJ family response regulator
MAIRVLIADDHSVVRQGLQRRFFEARVVAERPWLVECAQEVSLDVGDCI